jgi:hypothetical protein
MAIWKDSNGALHDDMEGTAINMQSWPSGMTLLTDEEAYAIQQPAKTEGQLASELRVTRNERLSKLDKVILRHRREIELGTTTKLTDEQFKQVLQIAQDLANVPEQSTFPTSVTWPTQPAWLVDPDGDE